ncbi:Chitinase 2 [Coemansia linderi]|uniref:Chitinase 2 n=1 Tax=Coemansia linderi TaxID=2663919 RepID=A0ACC1KHR5_9FUNG|nr:Chitinase 2 [Coemansia linderi]
MRQPVVAFLLACCCAFGASARDFNIHCNSNLVAYWGQNSLGATNPGENQLPLDEYCDKEIGDVLILSFLSEFNADGLHPPTLNLANACLTTYENSTLLHCPNIGRAIDKCQKKGKAVILSLGGASGVYGFNDDIQAERYADEIWDMFLGGYSHTRPFDATVLDGIDLDIEGGSSVGYVRFVQRLRERFIESPGRRYYVTAAPQCPYPDFYSGPILDNAYLDMVFVQFYNNYCGVDKANWFNFEQWHEWATTISANKDVRVYLGVPGSPSAASTGYMPIEKLEELVNATRSRFSSFGGMMVWDASQADSNRDSEDTSFADLAKIMLDSGKKCTDGSDKVPATEDDSSSSQTSSAISTEASAPRSIPASSNSEATSQRVSAKALTRVEVSEVNDDGGDWPIPSDKAEEGDLDEERLQKASAKTLLAASADSTDSSDQESSNTDDASSTQDTTSDLSSTDSTASDSASSENAADSSSTDGSADSSTDSSSDTQSESDSSSAADNDNETTTMETTKLIVATTTKTRKVHIVTKHVTTRIQVHAPGLGSALSTEASPTITNKTTSIVTPTFPLPIARCPRADQPCIGAGFACNGYEFGQCVNNRWLMRPCSMDRMTACFNAGPDLVACDFPKGRSLQVCDDILSPLPYGRLASNVLFLRGSDQERALNTPVYPVPSSAATFTTHVKKKKDDDEDDDEDTEDDDEDYIYNKYGEKKKNTATPTITDMELVKQSSGVNLIDDHNRHEDPAMLMAKDPEAYYGPDGHVRAVAGNVVDDLRKHNSFGTESEPYDENPPVDDPEEGDEYSDGDEFMRKRDLGAMEDPEPLASPTLLSEVASTLAHSSAAPSSTPLAKRNTKDLVGASVSMAHISEATWRSQVEDFYAVYALYAALSGTANDLAHQQFERVITDHIDGDFLIPPHLPSLLGRPMLARFTFVPMRGEDPNFMHYRTKDGLVEEDILVSIRMMTNEPIPRRWRVALPLPLNATMLHTSRGSFYAGDRVSAEIKSIYVQRVAFYNENIRLNADMVQSGPEIQRLNDLAAGHSSNVTSSSSREFSDGPNYKSIKRNLISPSVISQILHKKPASPPPPELLDEPVPNDPAGRLYEVRSNPAAEKDNNMAIRFTIRVKTRAAPGQHVASALPHPILSFITAY